jgi:autotransporter-associated beta strand protein
MAQFVIDFSDRIYAVMGIRPIVYCNGNYAANILGTASLSLRTQVVAGNLLWSARWPNQSDPNSIPVQTGNPKDSYTPIYGPWDDPPNPVHPWKFWQYASTARLNGYANGGANIDVDVAQGGIEFLKDQLVPALWVTNSSGQWTTLTNWNSGLTPTAPVQGPGQVPRVGSMTLPETRLPGSDDTVILDRPGANITVTLASGTHVIRKLYVRETLNINGGSLTAGYVPTIDSTTIAAQFSGPVTLSGSGGLSLHTLQVDAAQTFTLAGGTLTFNTINLMPHATTPAKILLAGDVTLSGLSSTVATIANGVGTGSSGLVDLGGATRTFDVVNVVSGVDLSVNVPITNGALNKIGAGTLGLNAVNTYSGTTTVQAGRIELGGSLNGSVTVSGGVLAFGPSTGSAQ